MAVKNNRTAAITPLDVLLREMRAAWDAGDTAQAVTLAKAAAPYVHPRAPSVAARAGLERLGDDALEQLCRGGEGREGAAAEDTDEP
jgi:hypothetical protein